MSKSKIIYTLLLNSLLFLGSNYTSAVQKDEFKFERLSLEKGAALNLTYCMLQDHKGFIWFGTMYGLVKYDGKDFRVYKNNPDDPNSVSFDDIISLYEDSQNNIWIGTWGGGLNKFNPSTGNFTRFINEGSNENQISDNIIWTICEDNDGNMWFGTETGGLNKYNPGTNTFSHYSYSEDNTKSISSNSIRTMYKDRNGILWIGNQHGLSKYNKQSNDFTNYILSKNNPVSVISIMEDEKNNFWIGTQAGLYNFDRKSGDFIHFENPELPDQVVYSICEGKDGNIWIGSSSGLFNLNPNTNKIRNYKNQAGNIVSLSGNNILNLMTDKSGILWINAYNTGINKLNSNASRFTSYSNLPGDNKSLSNNKVTAFCQDKKNNIWIGTLNGLNKFDPQSETFERFYSTDMLGNRIASFALDNKLLWIATAKGLKLFNTETNKYSPLPPRLSKNKYIGGYRILSLLKDSSKNIFIGTYGNGLFIYHPENDSLNHLTSVDFGGANKRSNYILTLYQDNKYPEVIWIGTYGGLIKINIRDKKYKIYNHNLNDSKSLSNDYVFSIYRDSKNILWIGTANGLNKFDDNSNSFVHYFEKDGLPNSVISSILEDQSGNLWLSTNYGISEFNPAKVEFKNFDMEDGLQSNLFLNHSFLKDANGSLYFGGINGFNIARPLSIPADNYVPGVYITSVKKNNNRGGWLEINTENEIQLHYDENFVDINFISLDFNNPSKIVYKYKLDGVDESWINAGNKTSASYTKLQPGEYIFRVKGSNSNGVFNPNEAMIKFAILPPFWKTAWFNLSIALLLLASAYLFYRLKLRQKINRALEIEKIKEEESEKLRKKTAADFHDELGHRLTRISLLSEIIKRKIGNTSGELTELLNKISVNSKELFEGTKDFIWAIDPNKDSLYELLIRLKDFGDELFEDSDILFEVNGLDESLKNKSLSMDWKRHLALIFKEGMNNSLKYGKSKRISIDSKVIAENIEISLSDDGEGFIPGNLKKGNGLRNMRKRADNISASLEVISSPGNGTKILFKGMMPGKLTNYN